MSQEKILKTLKILGLSKLEARIYVHLARRKPQKAKDIAQSLKLIKQQVYPTLKKLQSKGIVTSTLERPARFSAVPFKKMLDLYVKAKMEEAQSVQRNMEELIVDWESIKIGEKKDSTPKFTVIEGRNYIYSRLKQMVQETKNHLSIITSVPNLLHADQFGVIDSGKDFMKKNAKLRFITTLYENEINSVKLFLKNYQKSFNFEGRVPDLGQKLKNQIIIKDENEALFFIDPLEDLNVGDKESTCLWTNSTTLVQAFTSLFEELWQSSTDINKKIMESETGKPTTKTYILSDKIESKKIFYEILQSAKNEIIMITSLDAFSELWKNDLLLHDFTDRGGLIKIMAPVTVENFQTAKQLSENINVKHLPESHLRTTLVDDLHLFQFRTPTSDEQNDSLDQYENALYTTDSEYIEKTKTMLNEIWNNASVLSSVTLKSIMNSENRNSTLNEKPYDVYRRTTGYVKDQFGSITEKDLMDKFDKKYIPSANDPAKDTTIMYGHGARALINPPEHLKLPQMIFTIFHCTERSTFGKENWLIVQVPFQTTKGERYVPATIIGDNAMSVDWRKKIHKGTPLEKYLYLAKEDELQVRSHGNILFAGWTIPILLGSEHAVLPPSCLFFEGYRELETGIAESKPTSKRIQKSEFSGLEAFVTYYHPSSKYSGPGTDGVIFRKMIITSSPK